MREIEVFTARIQLVTGDITRQDTEAVVNAANNRLAPGGGVAGAIHRAAGPQLWEECATLGGCETGQARISRGYDLPNDYVVHTVGPVYGSGPDDARLLRLCYLNSLALAEEHSIRTIAFPALSTGIFGYPVAEAARVALAAVRDYLAGGRRIELVRFVLYDQAAFEAHVAAWQALEAEGGAA